MTKEEAYQKATLQQLGNNPQGTRQDIIYAAMEIYADSFLKGIWINACCQTLKDISITFLKEENLSKADSISDRDVFQAIGESIRNFPIPDFPPKTK